MDIGITDHALERMIERGVTEADIRAAFLEKFEFLHEAIPGRKKIKATVDGRELIVIYAPEKAKRVIISAWWKDDA